jgi:hypothetical protein
MHRFLGSVELLAVQPFRFHSSQGRIQVAFEFDLALDFVLET